MTYKPQTHLESLKGLRAQNNLMDVHIRDGKLIDLFEMIRSQRQYLEYLIENTEPGDEK